MHSNPRICPALLTSAVGSLALLAACGSGGGSSSSSSAQGGFQLTSISVSNNDIWEINRAIEFSFNQPVDFSTVSLNTIGISQAGGGPVSGEFTLADSKTVVFQPTCPTLDDYSDAGLQPGGKTYSINVLGNVSGTLTVKSTNGAYLKSSQSRTFFTPNSTFAADVFLDTVVGPPSPVVRNVGSSNQNATYLEVGGDSGQKQFFEFDPQTQSFATVLDVPANLYSDVDSGVAVMLVINQAVNPASSNINSDRVKLEFFDGISATWKSVTATLELQENCTTTGALLRIEPLGVLPPGSQLRVVLTSAFEDLIGERNLLDVNNFARAETGIFDDPALTPSDDQADEFLESFDIGGTALGSFEDTSAAFSEPKAIWEAGTLTAAFDFTGTGGPGGTFDYIVPLGQTVLINTVSSVITGGPGFVNTTSQSVINGVMNVRNLQIDGTLKATGPYALTIQATGTVTINGIIEINGSDAKDVATLNTGNQPEVGGAGSCGGGTGGTASFLTSTSTPQGGSGSGSFNVPNLGGRGGESGFGVPVTTKDNRRPGGGGGGALGANNGSGTGLTAQSGKDGSTNATGAVTKEPTPDGGLPGTRPFTDTSTANDFWGTQLVGNTAVIIGELGGPVGGQGGGAGGDACPASEFPTPNWDVSSDEKGAGGGGGGGVIVIQALDTIILGAAGEVRSEGGRGGAGENSINDDHLGGGSGGGSGGYIVLQAGNEINLSSAKNGALNAKGGRAGFGKNGVNTTNAGGDGGPGIIQLHVLTQATDLVLGSKVLNTVCDPDPIVLVPTFGARSRARTDWIPLGGAKIDPLGGFDPITFFFGGTSTVTGKVLEVDDDDVVDDVAEVLGPQTLSLSPTVPFIATDGRTLVVDGSPLAGTTNDIYLRNPALVKNFKLRLREVGNPTNDRDFDVVSGSYNSSSQFLTLTTSSSGPLLTSFSAVNKEFVLIPRYLRVVTSGVLDSLPDNAAVTVTFQFTTAAADGSPDAALIQPTPTTFTPDIGVLNLASLGTVDFVRMEVLFDLDVQSTGLSATNPRPALQFLRLPFRF